MFFTYDLLEDKQVADINNSNILLYYCIRQLNSILIWICAVTVIDHRKCQNVVRTSVTHLAVPRVSLVLTTFWYYLWSTSEQTYSNMEFICWFNIFFLLITFLIYNRWIHIVCGRFVLVPCVSECWGVCLFVLSKASVKLIKLDFYQLIEIWSCQRNVLLSYNCNFSFSVQYGKLGVKEYIKIYF